MSFLTLTLADALSVASEMRQRDRECIQALLGPCSDETFAVNRWQSNGPAWSLYQGGRPVAVGGVTLQSAWSCVFWMYATNDISRESWRKLIRHTRTVLSNVTRPTHEHYRHRVEAYTLPDWTEAGELARRFGFVHEGVRRGYGSGGEDMNVWSIVGPPKGKLWQQAS